MEEGKNGNVLAQFLGIWPAGRCLFMSSLATYGSSMNCILFNKELCAEMYNP